MPSSAIIRKQIRDAIKARMALITGTGGYYTTIGANITIKKTNPYDAVKLDGIDIADESEEQTVEAEDESLEQRTINFKISIALKQVNPDIVLLAIADVEKAIKVDPTWGGLAIRTIPKGNSDEVDQQEFIFRGVNINIAVEYKTEIFNSE